MRNPVVVVNFKVYKEVLGSAGVAMAQMCARVAEETGASIAVAPAMPDLARVAAGVRIPVLSQHFDPVDAGSKTGWTPLEAIQKAGAVGTLLNHSERKMLLADLSLAVKLCRQAGIETIVCADTIKEASKVAKLHPDYVAIEPPELIGGSVSVTSARPEVVTDAVNAIERISSDVRLLCGAGVKTRRDVSKALELGTDGVLLASGVVKARSPKNALLDLTKGLTRD